MTFSKILTTLAQTNTLTTPSKVEKPIDLCGGFGPCLSGTQSYANGDATTIVTNLTTNVANFLIFLAAAIAVLFIVFGGYKFITANGDDSQIKSAKSMVINALIGIVVCIISYTLVYVVTQMVSTVNIGG